MAVSLGVSSISTTSRYGGCHVRESREITVSLLELDELCEERHRLVGSAHGNGAREGADDRDHTKYEVKSEEQSMFLAYINGGMLETNMD